MEIQYLYPHQFPNKGDVVLGNVVEQTSLGFTITLTEFNNAIGLMPLSELSKNRVKHVHSLMKTGMINKLFKVIDADQTKKIITLSFRSVDNQGSRFNNNDQDKNDTKLWGIMSGYAKKYNQLGLDIYKLYKATLSKTSDPIKDEFNYELFDQIRKITVWNFFDPLQMIKDITAEILTIDEASNELKDTYNNLIQTPEKLMTNSDFFNKTFIDYFVTNFHQRSKTTSGKLTQIIEIFTSASDGANQIVNILDLDCHKEIIESYRDDKLKIEITITSPPVYTLVIDIINMDHGKKLLDYLKSEFIAKAREYKAKIIMSIDNLSIDRPVIITVDHVSKKDWLKAKTLFFDMTELELSTF
jgi:translation initiation factor 2 alpha subunit (eIF-2alpha)